MVVCVLFYLCEEPETCTHTSGLRLHARIKPSRRSSLPPPLGTSCLRLEGYRAYELPVTRSRSDVVQAFDLSFFFCSRHFTMKLSSAQENSAGFCPSFPRSKVIFPLLFKASMQIWGEAGLKAKPVKFCCKHVLKKTTTFS